MWKFRKLDSKNCIDSHNYTIYNILISSKSTLQFNFIRITVALGIFWSWSFLY